MRIHLQENKFKNDRCYYLDWLRVIAMLLVFCFHVGRVYDVPDWQIKNPQGSIGMTVFTGFVIQWLMPLFFLLAGASSYLALRYKSKTCYIKERFQRLIIPFIFGLFILIPPQEYIQKLNEAKYNGSFINFYPHFLDGMRPVFNLQWFFAYSHNLWFLGFLFIFSLLALPILFFVRKKSSLNFVLGVNSVCQKKGGIFLFILPIAIIQVSLRARFAQYLDWADFFFWFAFFLYGFLIQSDKNYKTAIVCNGFTAMLLGIVCSGILVLLLAKGYIETWELTPEYTLSFALYQILRTINTWSWIVFLLSMSIKYMSKPNRLLKYANEAALPFYMIHQTVLFIAAFFIIQLHLSIILKFLLTFVLTFLFTTSIYEMFVRRFHVARFIFGLKRLEGKRSNSSVGNNLSTSIRNDSSLNY